MKKKLKEKATTCHSVRLYEADLTEIIEVMSSVTPVVKMSDNEFEYSTLEEVKNQRGLKTKNLVIESESPTIRLKIGPDKT